MKHRYLLVIILLISLLPFVPILVNPLLPHTSDGGVQIPRMAAFYKAVMDGHIPVRWAGDLNFGYGLPLFNFIYHFPFWISTGLLAMGLSLILTFKLTLLISFLGSGLAMYWLAFELFGDKKTAFWTTIMYQFAPFRLVEILVRGAIGGIYAYTFAPLVIVGVIKIIKRPTSSSLLLTAVATACLIVSHNSLSLLFFGLACLFIFIKPASSSNRLWGFLGLGLGVMLSAFFWLPAIAEHKYTYGDLFMKNLFRDNFPPFMNFFIPNITNSQTLRVSEINLQFGIIHTIAIAASIWLLTKQKLSQLGKRLTWICLITISLTLFFMQPVSIPIWERVSWLRQFQFPWRFLAIISFITSLLSAQLLQFSALRRWPLYIGVVILAIGSTAIFWSPTQGYDHVREQDFWNYPLNTTYFGETDVIWSAGPAHQYPKERIEIIAGVGTVKNFAKTTGQQQFQVIANTPVQIVSHTQYFPGWKVIVDHKKVPIQFQDQNWRGQITFTVPSGYHDISIVFAESPIRLIADWTSATAVIGIIGWISIVIIRRKKP